MKRYRALFRSFFKKMFLRRLGNYYNFRIDKLIKQLHFTQYQKINEIHDQQLKDLDKLLKNSDLSWYEKKGNGRVTIDKIVTCSIGISKDELRAEFKKLYKSSGREFDHITSGSTGQPLKVTVSSISEAHRIAHRIRFYDWWGITPRDRNILIWGGMSVGQVKRESVKRRIKKKLIKTRELFINVFELSENNIQNLYEQCVKKKAAYIRGYTSGIYQFCSLLHKNNLDGKKLGLKLAIVTSEILLEDHRNFITETLGCKVANEYGAAEIGLFACECPEGSMHINEELNLLQTRQDGSLLVTDLHNTSTPLLNYEIGDRIVISEKPCSCGRGLRVIEKIMGREGDLIKKPNGEFISQYVFYYAVKDIEAMGFSGSISQYKVIQQGLHFTVFIIKGSDFKEEAVNLFVERITQNIGKEISVNIEFVNEVPKEKNGKIRFFQRFES